MHAAATILCIALAQTAQPGGYSNAYETGDQTGRQSVTAGARTRSTRAVGENLHGNYPAERVANNPRYAADVPVDDGRARAPEDPRTGLARTLLSDLILGPADTESQTIRLYDSLEQTAGAQQQFTAVKAYWEWCLAVAELQGAAEEQTILARMGTAGRTPFETAFHTAHLKSAHSRLEDSKLDVAARLVDLRTVTGLRVSNVPVRPADLPWVGAYDTKYERMFSGRTAPGSLTRIFKTLPYALNVLRVRSESYNAARHALVAAEEAYSRSQGSFTDLVDALSLMRNQRRAFLDSVHDYNFSIAEYALTVAPGLQRETVVTMLLPTSGRYRGASYDNRGNMIAPVSGEYEAYDAANNGGYNVQRPFAESLSRNPHVPHDADVRRLQYGKSLR